MQKMAFMAPKTSHSQVALSNEALEKNLRHFLEPT
jgi:hypothetical protein